LKLARSWIFFTVELWCHVYTVGDEIDNFISAPQLNPALDRKIASGIARAHTHIDEAR